MREILLAFAVLALVFVLASEIQAARPRRRVADAVRSRLPQPVERVSLRR